MVQGCSASKKRVKMLDYHLGRVFLCQVGAAREHSQLRTGDCLTELFSLGRGYPRVFLTPEYEHGTFYLAVERFPFIGVMLTMLPSFDGRRRPP
jgi:hypothetical protein